MICPFELQRLLLPPTTKKVRPVTTSQEAYMSTYIPDEYLDYVTIPEPAETTHQDPGGPFGDSILTADPWAGLFAERS